MAERYEIMGLALFLASRYLTGAQIVIDGGASLGFADWSGFRDRGQVC